MIRYRYEGKGFEEYRHARHGFETAFLKGLFFSMLRIRRVEEAIEADYHKDQMKTPIHLMIGQEACAVGAAAALRREDLVYSGHRTHGIYLAKGGSLNAMMAELFCRSTGCAGSRGGSMHLVDKSVGMAGSSAIVAGTVPITAGAALAAQILGKDSVSMVFLGDAATEEGVFSETLNFAALKSLPMIFFCENNYYSVQSSLVPRQPAGVEIWKRAGAFGLSSVLVDGNNVLDVYKATLDAWARARAGRGPTFIEARTYRVRAHGGAGDDSGSGYRDVEECAHWQKYNPVEMFFQFLLDTATLAESDRVEMEERIAMEIAEAFAFATASPFPGQDELGKYVYAGG